MNRILLMLSLGVLLAACQTGSIAGGGSVDLGVQCAPSCGTGQGCAAALDCSSGMCTEGKCQESTCTDHVKNGNETDVDCGGSCPPCANGRRCAQASDCTSQLCQDILCVPSNCMDHIKDGNEAGVDCGGSCSPCVAGESCSRAADCQSGVCTGMACQTPNCGDKIKNGTETDVDCGGGDCTPCANNQACTMGTDCQSDYCASMVCQVQPIALVAPVVTPASGPTSGGIMLAIDGKGFVSGLTVTVGGVAATNVTVPSSIRVQATLPPHPVGTADIVVKNPDGSQATAQGAFRYVPTLSFTAAVSVSAGNGAYAVAVGDIDGNGTLDLATSNYNGNNVSVLLGDGKGNFMSAPGSPIAVGSGPGSIAIGNWNSDKALDLAVTNYNDNTVSVLLGNGKGGFAAAPGSPLAVGKAPTSLATGKFDKGGLLDLVILNNTDNNLSMLLGDGKSSFTAAPNSPFASGKGPRLVAVSDFNGDGVSDLAVTNYLDGTVSVLLGDGKDNLTATAGSPITVSTYPYAVAAGDINGDGIADLAITSPLHNNVSVLLGDGKGGFTPDASGPFTVNGGDYAVTVGDVNGDGFADLAVADLLTNSVSVLLGDGTGSFATAQSFAVDQRPYGIALADFNGDGKLDLVTANYASNTVSILINTSK